MNDTDGRTHQMLVRSREAFAQCVNDFSEAGAARQLFTDLQAAIIEVEQKAAAHGAGRSDANKELRRSTKCVKTYWRISPRFAKQLR